ncbi:MAG: AsmA family protein [Desulfobacteraceae bacterium]|nr:AsmA family protein [Desulfobacteraceae bacterium]MDH3836730.1 AsmA family protein [Desulfobacteraceae bacterium]
MAIHKKKVLYITTGVITLVVFVGIIALMLNIKGFTPQIEAAASTVLGMDVRIKGKVGIALFPGFGLSLKDVNVRNKGLDIVTIEKMRIGLKLIPLARFEIKIIRVGLVKPVFSILRSKNEMFNLEKPGRTLWEKLLAVKKISISQGSLVYTDEISGEKIEVGDLDLSIRNLFSGGTDSSELFKNISFTGDIRCKILKIYNVTLMNLVMRAAGEKGILDINPVSMNIFGGTGDGSIQVDLTGSSPYYRVIYTLNRVRIEELLQQYSLKKFPRKTIEGPVNFSADLTAMGKSEDEVKRSLNGNLSLNGDNLMLYNIDIDALIMKYERSQNFNLVDVGAFFLAGPFGPALTKSYNFARLYEESQGGKGIIRKLVSDWKVKKGIAEALDVALASKKQRIAMKGGLNLINERFVDVTIAALDKRGCAVYSEKVHGSFHKPQIEKESIFTSITGSVSNPLEDMWKFIQGKKCTVFYSGSVAQPEG